MTGSDASPQASLGSEEEQRPSRSTSDDDKDMPDLVKKEQNADENVDSSSTGSDGDKSRGGSGNGEGYSADYSSSDSSSLDAAKGKTPEKQMHRLSLDGGGTKEKTLRAKEARRSKGPKQGAQQTESCYLQPAKEQELDYESSADWSGSDYESSEDGGVSQDKIKQWNGVSISHPMDPRIDLSTVGHIHTSSVPAFPSDVDIPSRQSEEPPENSGVGTPPPSIDQYIKLMEGHSHARSDETSHERPSFDFATEAAGERKIEAPVAAWNTSRVVTPASPYSIYLNEDVPESDSSSGVVLARVKRNHLKKSPEDPTNYGPNTSANEGANAASSSSDKKVRIQQPQHAGAEELLNEGGPMDQDDSNVDPGEGMRAQAHEEEPAAARRQKSTSASSIEERNNEEDALQDGPLHCGVPAVVSEYSSSARASSGASNNNIMSTSGSGSGGNTGSGTGSGTASGSNEGGSSGSGNDQGGSSANGNGSSASGNDAKGSSEETMDNSGENNSGENSGGNSDETNSNNKKCKTAAAVAPDAHVGPGHRHSSNVPETLYRDPALQPQPLQAHDDGHHNAAREKKLQNKKRKRMNMRREYEEKVQQEMESSEGSRDRGEIFLRPGKPVTLDTVLSFTKIARIVIKADPPFLVVYTNAAYSRLSGIDSHAAVGKPIASLLSVPDPDTLAKIGNGNEGRSMETLTAGTENVCESVHQEENGHFENEMKNENGSAGSFAVEAAGRARAVASQEDPTEMGLERLVAASGFGRCHVIHVSAKPHHMLGRNVTVTKQVDANGTEMRSREEGMSNGSVITGGYDGPYHMETTAVMGVSPVVSSPEAFTAAVVTDKDQDNHHNKTKRRKHHHHSDSQHSNATHHQHRRNSPMREVYVHRKRHLITHFAIQLELYEGTFRKVGGLESHSSTSTTVEAHMLGLTKSELRRQRMRGPALRTQAEDGSDRLLDDEDDDEMESESSEPREPVAAIG